MYQKLTSAKSTGLTTQGDDMALTKAELTKRLDKLVSVLVRFRDTKCCTCGKYLLFNKREAGHYIPRVVLETRWDLRNVNTQCHECNVGKAGNLIPYRQYINRVYGPEALQSLDNALLLYNAGLSPKMTLTRLIGLYNAFLRQVRQRELLTGKEFIPKSWECYNKED